jgi:putative holliday junction resolvase
MSRTVLAVDPGSRRVGVAVSNPEGTFALPLEVIERSSDDSYIDRLADLAESRGVGEVVVGLPLRLSGSHGPEVAAARALAEKLRERLGVPVHLVDERLTTRQAEASLAGAGLNSRGRRGRVDQVAAAVLLQGFLDGKPEAGK